MRTPSFVSAILFLTGAIGAGVGCAGARPAATPATETTTTGGEVSPPAAREAASPASETPASDVEEKEAAPAGRLVCRTKTVADGTSELYLDWDGPIAKGVVRRIVPSGMVHVQRVRAERYKDAIIVDDPNVVDLVTHAAVVGRQDGKQVMRIGDSTQPFIACE